MSAAPKPAALAAEAVSLAVRGGKRLLFDVTLEAASGERLAIIGPNGAGKTTLLQTLAGRLQPTSGRILLDGRDVSTIDRNDRARRIAVMAQSDRPDLRLRARDYVWLGRIPHARTAAQSASQSAVDLALQMTGAVAFADRALAALSGGEIQRLKLARALAQEPNVLLLDEPTNNLDLRARADLIEIAAGLGITVIAVLHDLTLAPDFADRIAVMAGGRLVVCAAAEEALADPIVSDVFGMDVYRLPHPRDGRPHLIFEKPQTKETHS